MPRVRFKARLGGTAASTQSVSWRIVLKTFGCRYRAPLRTTLQHGGDLFPRFGRRDDFDGFPPRRWSLLGHPFRPWCSCCARGRPTEGKIVGKRVFVWISNQVLMSSEVRKEGFALQRWRKSHFDWHMSLHDFGKHLEVVLEAKGMTLLRWLSLETKMCKRDGAE